MSSPVATAISTRSTTKVMFDPNAPSRGATDNKTLEDLVALAGWAPFHKPAHRSHWHGARTIEPWRFYMANTKTCRSLIGFIEANAEKAGRLPQMLAAAEALVLATWLPDPPDGEEPFDGLFQPTIGNMEHIAAAGAAVQSFLLAATERNLTTYWSSGGFIRQKPTFEYLGIPTTEVLLGAIFVLPDEGGQRIPGSLRDKRSDAPKWSRWVTPRA